MPFRVVIGSSVRVLARVSYISPSSTPGSTNLLHVIVRNTSFFGLAVDVIGADGFWFLAFWFPVTGGWGGRLGSFLQFCGGWLDGAWAHVLEFCCISDSRVAGGWLVGSGFRCQVVVKREEMGWRMVVISVDE